MIDKENQCRKMVREMRRRKVMNWEFVTKFHILSYSKRISEIRESGIDVSMERIWKDGKATGTFMYWIPRRPSGKKRPEQAMEFEEEKKSTWLERRLRLV